MLTWVSHLPTPNNKRCSNKKVTYIIPRLDDDTHEFIFIALFEQGR